MSRYEIDPDSSQVWVEGTSSVHPIRATATGLTGWLRATTKSGEIDLGAGLEGELRIAVERLESGNPLIDQETRRRIDARRHPEIVGSVTAARPGADGALTVTGDLTLRGEVRSVNGDVVLSMDGDRLVVEGSQAFDVRDWGLRPPRIALLRVHPEVLVRVHVVADPQE